MDWYDKFALGLTLLLSICFIIMGLFAHQFEQRNTIDPAAVKYQIMVDR